MDNPEPTKALGDGVESVSILPISPPSLSPLPTMPGIPIPSGDFEEVFNSTDTATTTAVPTIEGSVVPQTTMPTVTTPAVTSSTDRNASMSTTDMALSATLLLGNSSTVIALPTGYTGPKVFVPVPTWVEVTARFSGGNSTSVSTSGSKTTGGIGGSKGTSTSASVSTTASGDGEEEVTVTATATEVTGRFTTVGDVARETSV